eukprot:scaffold319382_cov26-Tisochrysis_lutea.AAC.2
MELQTKVPFANIGVRWSLMQGRQSNLRKVNPGQARTDDKLKGHSSPHTALSFSIGPMPCTASQVDEANT